MVVFQILIETKSTPKLHPDMLTCGTWVDNVVLSYNGLTPQSLFYKDSRNNVTSSFKIA